MAAEISARPSSQTSLSATESSTAENIFSNLRICSLGNWQRYSFVRRSGCERAFLYALSAKETIFGHLRMSPLHSSAVMNCDKMVSAFVCNSMSLREFRNSESFSGWIYLFLIVKCFRILIHMRKSIIYLVSTNFLKRFCSCFKKRMHANFKYGTEIINKHRSKLWFR